MTGDFPTAGVIGEELATHAAVENDFVRLGRSRDGLGEQWPAKKRHSEGKQTVFHEKLVDSNFQPLAQIKLQG